MNQIAKDGSTSADLKSRVTEVREMQRSRYGGGDLNANVSLETL